MTRFVSLMLLAAGVAAQQINTTALTELAQAIQGLGFTELANAAATIANTSTGAQLLSTITNGNDKYTIFAPTNDAISSGNQTLLKDPDSLAAIFSYHIVPGTYTNQSDFFSTPNNTILPTLLNATDFVNLQGNATQVLSLTVRDNTVTINNQNGTVEVSKVSNATDRFTVLTIDRVLQVPESISTVARRQNLTQFTQILEQAGITDLVGNAKGITIFAPTDDAIQKALAQLGGNVSNTTLIQTILQNHVINGTAVYSTEFDDKNFTSAAGQDLNFYVRNNTITVYSGDNNTISANITRRDVLVSNGVIHIIDAVLANTQRDDNAASSAYQSATDSANDAKPTGGNGGNSGPVGGGPPDNNNNGGDAAPHRFATAWTVVAAAAFVGAMLTSSL